MRIVEFSSPINASNYVGGAGVVKGVQILSVNYETAKARVHLVNENDTVRQETNGIDIANPETDDDEEIAETVRATIAATNE